MFFGPHNSQGVTARTCRLRSSQLSGTRALCSLSVCSLLERGSRLWGHGFWPGWGWEGNPPGTRAVGLVSCRGPGGWGLSLAPGWQQGAGRSVRQAD